MMYLVAYIPENEETRKIKLSVDLLPPPLVSTLP